MKVKNENMINKDYFYEDEKVEKKVKQEKKRSISSNKKVSYHSKKLKKGGQVEECASPRCPKGHLK